MIHRRGLSAPARGRLRLPVPVVVVCGLWAALPQAGLCRLVINEIHPDPAGTDEGREFVEILNTGPDLEYLQDVTIEFGNGADGPAWTVRWSGPAGAVLPAQDRYLVADRNWQGPQPADAQVWLGLQNGPDAVRLVRQDVVLDLVGYGALTDPAMLEGQAVPLTPGLSLARRPDGRDTQDNAADFCPAQPTPGLPNFLDWDPRVLQWTLEPPSLDRPRRTLQVAVTLVNAGLLEIPTGPVSLECGTVRRHATLDRLVPGQEATLAWVLEPQEPGHLPLAVRIPGTAPTDTLVLTLGWVQVGPSALVLNEILPTPGQGQGEWVEVRNLSEAAVDLRGYRLGDADGPGHALPACDLRAGALVVIAEDSTALWAWESDNRLSGGSPATGPLQDGWLRQAAGWPTLNNSPPQDRDFCDRVILADTAGTVIDHVVLGPADFAAGDDLPQDRSWERLAAAAPAATQAVNWALSTALCGSTPGRPNSVTAPVKGGTGVTLEPSVLDPAMGVTVLHVLFEIPVGMCGCRVRLYDVWGHLVRDLGGDDAGPGSRAMFWDGRDDEGRAVPPGLYVLLLERSDPQGRAAAREKICLGVR